VVFGGGYLIRFLVRFCGSAKSIRWKEPASNCRTPGFTSAGWNGSWLSLRYCCSHGNGWPDLTAKSIAAYPEFKSERFAEYS